MSKLPSEFKNKINSLLKPFDFQITASKNSEEFNLYKLGYMDHGPTHKIILRDETLEHIINYIDMPIDKKGPIRTILLEFEMQQEKLGEGGTNMPKTLKSNNFLFSSIKEITPLLTSSDINLRLLGEFWEIKIRRKNMRDFVRLNHLTRENCDRMSGQAITMDSYKSYVLDTLRSRGIDPYDPQYVKLCQKLRNEPVITKPTVSISTVAIALPSATKKKTNIKQVFVNETEKVVVVLFGDGTKEVVKCSPDDAFDPYVGVSVAVTRHQYGTTSKFRREVDKVTTIVKPKVKKVKVEAVKKGRGRPKKATNEGGK